MEGPELGSQVLPSPLDPDSESGESHYQPREPRPILPTAALGPCPLSIQYAAATLELNPKSHLLAGLRGHPEYAAIFPVAVPPASVRHPTGDS